MPSSIGPAKRALFQLLREAPALADVQVAYRMPDGDLRAPATVALGPYTTANANALLGPLAAKNETPQLAILVRVYDDEADADEIGEGAADLEERTLAIVDAVRSVVHGNRTLRLTDQARGSVMEALVATTESDGPERPNDPPAPGLMCTVVMAVALTARAR